VCLLWLIRYIDTNTTTGKSLNASASKSVPSRTISRPVTTSRQREREWFRWLRA
jgi:hypothetical protein